MDELLALQRELAEVQSAPSVVRLSEPNIVEMMLKLKDLGLVDVLHTSNGKEYLTPKQLRNEVADEILAHNGRINITELAPILNVDLPYVEHAVDELLKKEEGGLQLFQGELIASYYLDSLAEEINQTLQGSGRVTLAELAVQHVLPTEFMQKVIEPRLNTVVKAKLASGVLYTSAYVDRHAARVRGVLCACLRPTGACVPMVHFCTCGCAEVRRCTCADPHTRPGAVCRSADVHACTTLKTGLQRCWQRIRRRETWPGSPDSEGV